MRDVCAVLPQGMYISDAVLTEPLRVTSEEEVFLKVSCAGKTESGWILNLSLRLLHFLPLQ